MNTYKEIKKLYLVRHGQTSFNKEKRLQGQLDTPLNKEGTQQALLLKNCLSDIEFDGFYSSPLARAKDTCYILRSAQPEVSFSLVEGLAEINHGNWQGRLIPDIAQEHDYDSKQLEKNLLALPRPEGAETTEQLQYRVDKAWDEIIQDSMRSQHENVCIVAHRYVIQALLCSLSGKDLTQMSSFVQSNCGVSLIQYYQGITEVIFTNKCAEEFLPQVAA